MTEQTLRDTVWVSQAFTTIPSAGPIPKQPYEDKERWFAVPKRVRAGERVPIEDLPRVFASESRSRKLETAAHAFIGRGFLCLSGALAAVLEGFDLGGTTLVPVKVVNHDCSSIAGDYRVLNLGEHKRVLAPEACSDGVEQPYGPEQDIWGFKYDGKDNDVAVHRSALKGVDLWVDPNFRSSIFFSGPLVEALRHADMDEPFKFKRCRVV